MPTPRRSISANVLCVKTAFTPTAQWIRSVSALPERDNVEERRRDAERLVKAVGNGASLRAWVTARPAIDLQLLGGYREEVQ